MNDNKQVKQEFGLTLKTGKERAKKLLGRLLKPGREVCIQSGIKDHKQYRIYLQNYAGKLEYRLWFGVNYAPYENQDFILGED